tara:strand:+ start:733 stop:1590 length:858 start_codon:yes stop_codon:yes gene_type:complete
MSEDKKIDYLEVDDPIPGQNYVCLSFLSPENLIQNKEAFKCTKFLQSYCKDQKLKFEEVYNKYQDFVYKYEDKLQRDFDEQNDFQTSIRGLKVRGVFNTKEEAQEKAKRLSLVNSAFHTFVGQVGYWLPWDPNADKIESEVFQNSQLNDMMEKYEENNINRDIFYEEQKRDKIKAAKEEVLKAKAEEKRKKEEEENNKDEYLIEDSEKSELEIDINKEEQITESGPSPYGSIHDSDEEEKDDINESVTPEEIKKGSEVSEEIKDSLESEDPWLQRKTKSEKKEKT